MAFPESERVVYAQNPIVEVICQLRFPPILTIAREAPAQFQDAIRTEYPLYERQAAIGGLPADLPAEMAQLVQNLPVFQTASPTHRFSNAEQTREIALTAEFLAVSERNYTEWASMRREIERARAALEAVYQPAFYERVGLRYRNRLDRVGLGLASRRWSEILRSEVTGLLGAELEIGNAVREATTVTELAVGPVGRVRLQCGLEAGTDSVFIIDADFFEGGRSESGRTDELLGGFNHEAGNLFRWAIERPLHERLVQRG